MTGPRLDDRGELLARVDLADLWCELVGPRSRGGWRCPARDHEQSGKSPPVSLDAGRGVWRCHGCGAGGSAVDLLVLVRGCTVAEAFGELRRQAGMTTPLPARAPVPRREPQSRPMPPAAAERALSAFLHRRGWRREVADTFGLHAVADRWGCPRLRFPYVSGREVVWHQDRALSDRGPKWLAPSGKRPMLYAEDLAVALDALTTPLPSKGRPVALLVEGPADLIALAHALDVVGCVVAMPGTDAIPTDRIAAAMPAAYVLVVADNDQAGERLRAELGKAVVAHGGRVAHVRLPADVNDLDDQRRALGCDDDAFAAWWWAAVEAVEWAEVGRVTA